MTQQQANKTFTASGEERHSTAQARGGPGFSARVDVETSPGQKTVTHSMSRYSVSHMPSQEHQNVIEMRKRLELLRSDEQKISNRVGLLQKEEARILGKIEETRTRATKFAQIKSKNDAGYLEKLSRKRE